MILALSVIDSGLAVILIRMRCSAVLAKYSGAIAGPPALLLLTACTSAQPSAPPVASASPSTATRPPIT